MALKKREKILALVTGLLVAALLGRLALTVLGSATGGRQADHDKLVAEVAKKHKAVRTGQVSAARLAEWQKRSLPSDHETARSLYQNWLSTVADGVGFQKTRVESSEGRLQHNAYYLLPFTIRAQARMEDLVRFLYQFYQAGHLHQIRHLSIKPQDGAKTLELVISIEALALPGATRSDKLSTEPGPKLSGDKLSTYRKSIVDRDLFAAYVPAGHKEEPKPEPQKFDPSKHAYLTAVIDVDGRPQAWLLARTTGETFKLFVGNEFTVGLVHAKVTGISQREVELEVDGQHYQVALGKNLREVIPAKEVKSEQ